ncbi:MAG: M1 family metallopeptidase [Rhodospirillaceae bacterium]|nr:M1 family metallopeptidase [Rhodospirillaceae bacterium]
MRRFGFAAAAVAIFTLFATASHAQQPGPALLPKNVWQDKFRQLDEVWPTANDYRTASGAPGHRYWQQKVDYKIKVKLDDAKQKATATETITYTNNSPDTLKYLWLNLDLNQLSKNSGPANARANDGDARESFSSIRLTMAYDKSTEGLLVSAVTDANGAALKHTFAGTMMRVDLPTPLKTGESTVFNVAWTMNVPEVETFGTRGGYEYFKDDKNYQYYMAQWFPRLAAYSDSDGWHIRQFYARSEFTLEFGDYEVEIDVPSDHVVAGTGELQNAGDVLTATQRDRLEQAKTAKKPVVIVGQDEATAKESAPATARKIWKFKAANVRDFAWASSRKFIWDAQGHEVEPGRTVLAMSFYPKEGNPLWEKYSTATLIHSLDVYGRFTFPYPYPVIQSINGNVGGMEYPMLAFNSGRPEKDKKTGKLTYSSRTKYALISVIIHEAGHNWFPMIVNSDERRWTWLDEGLNTFLQFQAERLWEKDYPAQRGEPKDIVDYMKSPTMRPIMTDGESLDNIGANAYAKPATAINILRETILGRELFDFAFKEYATRWYFKRANPPDFFRTLEDASGYDLDWFWRGWFYSVDNVDIAIDGVDEYTFNTQNPDIEQPLQRKRKQDEPRSLTEERNEAEAKGDGFYKMEVDEKPELKDFYNQNDRYTVTNADRNKYNGLVKDLEPWERELLKSGDYAYVMDFRNIGGLVMPVILGITYKDGSTEELRIPADVWRQNPQKFSKLIVRKKQIESVQVDPRLETSDIDTENNNWPRKAVPSRLELFKVTMPPAKNMMKDMDEPLKKDEKKEDNKKDEKKEPEKK